MDLGNPKSLNFFRLKPKKIVLNNAKHAKEIKKPLVTHGSLHFHNCRVPHDQVVMILQPMFVIKECTDTGLALDVPVIQVLEIQHRL